MPLITRREAITATLAGAVVVAVEPPIARGEKTDDRLAKLIPELAAPSAEPADGPAIGVSEREQFLLFDAVASLLGAICDEQPLMTFHVEICEDLWVPIPPSSYAALAGCV